MERHIQLTSLLAPALFLFSGLAIASEPGVVVLRSDENSLVFEYRPRYSPPRTIVSQSGQFVLYDFEGSMQHHTSETIGSPDLRHREFPVGFAGRTGNAVTLVQADYEDIPNVQLAPVPRYTFRNDLLELSSYSAAPSSYSRNTFMPGRVLELSPIGKSRTMLLGNVRVSPLQYNPVTRVLRKYSRIVVEVTFAPTIERRVRNDDDVPFAATLLNYGVARNWKFDAPRSPAKVMNQSSVLASGNWYRMAITEEGMYKLDAQFLQSAGINLAGVDPRTIKIYGNQGRMLPEDMSAPRPQDLLENAIYVEGESDGRFDTPDYILFFGKGVRGFEYDPAGKTLRHYIHTYSEENYYWLTFGGTAGRRMGLQNSSGNPAAVVPSKFDDMVFIEEEKVNVVSSGKSWLGKTLLAGDSFTFTAGLPGLVSGSVIRYRYTIAARSSERSYFMISQNGIRIDSLGVDWNGDDTWSYLQSGTFESVATSTLGTTTSSLSIGYRSNAVSATGWIDWVEVIYPRSFDPVNNYLRFRSPDTTAVVEYRLGTFAVTPMFFNVTRPDSVTRIQVSGSSFRAVEGAGKVSEYCVAAPNAFKTPPLPVRISNQDLHGVADSVAFVIVTSTEFKTAADRLAAYREQPARGNLRTRVVLVDQIYNEFSGGVADVAGIRDFLKYAYDHWTPSPTSHSLQYVLLFGAASYDYKGILGAKSSFVPTWEGGPEYDGVNSTGSDDFFAAFDSDPNNRLLSLTLGRLNARQPQEADLLVDKIIRYEENSEKGAWKTRILYVGDDGWTSDVGDTEGSVHSAAAEYLSENCTPKIIERKKIYIAEYPTVNTAQGRRKPGAYQDIIDEINRGVLIINFTGHGNPVVWAHENVFNVQTSTPQLVNANKLALFFAATCNFSQYDDPKRYTGSEVLMNKPDGGGIAVIAASRKVFGDQNNYLNWEVFRRMFVVDRFGRVVVHRPADGLFLKKATSNGQNDQKFVFLGDPTMYLQYPRGFASIDSVNGQAVDSVNGEPRVTPIRLRSLERVTVKGTVRDALNRPDTTFTGDMSLVVNDASRTVTIVDFSPGINWDYLASGALIFRGVNSVVKGKISGTFIVPKDIAFADSTGRMLGYVHNQSTDGVGYSTKIRLAGTDTTARRDTTGPTVDIYLDSRGFKGGDLVSEIPTLLVDLFDSSGINTSVAGIGHRIEAWVNNNPQSKDMTDFYSSRADNYQAGTVQYQLRDLPQGNNSIRVRAWDTYNNARTAETFFVVASTDRLRITDVFNYPNPFGNTTEFTFRQNQLVPLNVTVKIYTLAGRLIHSLNLVSPGDPFVRIPWDGRDRDGDRVANGVYLYKILARTVDGRFSSEVIGKLAVAR